MTLVGKAWKAAIAVALAAIMGMGAGVLIMGKAPVLPAYAKTAATAASESLEQTSRSPWDVSFFPNDPVITHDGRTLRFYDDLIKNKIVVFNFIYTSCSNICPLVTARLSYVKDLLGDRVGRDFFFVSITIDPITDGPEMLSKYAQTYNAGPGWMFVTGQPEHIDNIRFKLGQRSNVKAEHRNDLMIGNDRTGTWGRDSAFTDPNVLADTIRGFDPNWRKPANPEVAREIVSIDVGAKYELHNKPGSILFAKACSSCHSIGHGDIIGPDLAGVLQRRDHDWLRRFLREPDMLRRQKDGLAIALDEKYPGVRMPNLGLSDNDIDDLFAFFKSHVTNEVASTGQHAPSNGATAAPH